MTMTTRLNQIAENLASIRLEGTHPTRAQTPVILAGLNAVIGGLDPAELHRRTLGFTATAAVEKLQQRAGLPSTGILDEATFGRLRSEVSHAHIAASPGRTRRLQDQLTKAGFPPADDEVTTRRIGPATSEALRNFQQEAGLVTDGLAGEATRTALADRVLATSLLTKTQIAKLQRSLLRAARIRGIDLSIDSTEMKARKQGPSTQKAIRELQSAFNLPVTGAVDVVTLDRIRSVAASRNQPMPVLAKPDPSMVQPIHRTLALNTTGADVLRLQRALAFLGHPPAEAEANAARFGATTRKAVLAFQAAHGLLQTGKLDPRTKKALNFTLVKVVPGTAPSPRIRGSLRDTAWNGIAGATVTLSTNPLAGAAVVLGTRATRANGFYDLPYITPTDPSSGQPLSPLSLKVTFTAPDGSSIGTKELLNPSSITWVNFTQGPYPYAGPSLYREQLAAVAHTGAGPVSSLVENEKRHDVTRVAQAAGLTQDDVMRIILAERVAAEFGTATLDAEVCFAFLSQNQPANLPSDLLAQTAEWALIDQLTDMAALGIAFTEPALARAILDSALIQNLVHVTLAARHEEISEALTSVGRMFALDKPLLVGNGTLRAVLGSSAVPADSFDAVADAFLATGGLGETFWTTLRDHPAPFGGAAAVRSLELVVDVGLITKNHPSMAKTIHGIIAEPADTRLGSSRDMAKLSPSDWVDLIVTEGVTVPTGTDGNTDEDRRLTYARTMTAQSERIYPTVALTAELARSNDTQLTKLPTITDLVDAHPTLELRQTNLAHFTASNAIDLDETTRTELRVLQRVHRLAPTAVTARILLEQGLHSSMQLVSLGKAEVVRRLGAAGVDERTALTIAGYAEFQYAQVLQRLGEFRSELQRGNPAALAPQTLTAAQREDLLGDIPDLELLFGPLDVCDCPHCASVLGPAAYLADVMRFLDAHPAESGDRSVWDVLAERRPDLGQVLLDCPNTDTRLPYIDLVNELLEAAIPGSSGGINRQTTRTENELRAAPEHIDVAAYDVLRTESMPMSSAFDLWQEESRTFTAHLGVPRWKLMGAFTDRSASLSVRADIAAEYFGISSHEANLITTDQAHAAAQNVFWGFDSTRSKIGVPEILTHTQLRYPELLLLIQVGTITPPGAPRVTLERPADVADLTQQWLTQLTPNVLDRMHRLVRLRRHMSWDLWELDLLIRADRIAGGRLDPDGLIALHEAAQLADRLGLGAEDLATWFGALPMEGHPDANDPTNLTLAAPSAYATIYNNRSVVDPPDPVFVPPVDAPLDDHRPALCAALAVSDDELSALSSRTGTVLNLATLSALASWVGLARALNSTVTDLLLLADLLAPLVPDPFAGPAALHAFLDTRSDALSSGVSVPELDYLLGARPASPMSSSDPAVTAILSALRESLRTNPAADAKGQVATYLAGILRMLPSQVVALLAVLDTTDQMSKAFSEPAFTARDANGAYSSEVTTATFPRLFEVYRRLQKMARVVELFQLDLRSLEWLLTHGDLVGALRLSHLPVAAPVATSLAAPWVALSRWNQVRQQMLTQSAIIASGAGSPKAPTTAPEDLVAAVANRRSVKEVRAIAKVFFAVDVATLRALDGGKIARYKDPVFLLRLALIAAQVARLGVSASQARAWSRRETGGVPSEHDIAVQIRSAAKAKYEAAAWATVLTPIQDTLRERKRDALVAFLLEHSARTEPESVDIDGRLWRNPRRWSQASDLLNYFLVDPNMSSCQLTSRIKQAIGSVQMFVQRVFLNLEKPYVLVTSSERADATSPDAWSQWKWMKSEQLWTANRTIFLYPENWITPELRDDKTPFFVDFESELQQSEITTDSAETALRHYLQKVHEVAHLEVTGVYHEIEDDNPGDKLPPTTNVLHAIGRTRSDPARYYYRSFDLNEGAWAAWSLIDVDISAEHVVPVVYNRSLHLFWLQITEKQTSTARQPAAQTTSTTQPAPSPPKQLEIKLAWTQRSDDGWSARQISRNVLVHPWQRPVSAYTLKPRYSAPENRLWLDVYISMSLEFNNTKFWDPFSGLHSFVTARRYDETARPWHSSSFVFDGQVVDLRLKPLIGQYHVLDGAGVPSDELTVTDSYHYVRSLTDPSGRRLRPLLRGQRAARLAVPGGMHLESGRFINNTWTPNTGRLTVLEGGSSVTLLNSAKPPFGVIATLQNGQFDTSFYNRTPFFYTDAARAYFVTAAFHDVVVDSTRTVRRLQYTFSAFDHPYSDLLLRELNRTGPDGVLNRKIQRFPQQYPPTNTFSFNTSYSPISPTVVAAKNAATDTLDFTRSGATSIYNWEIFFHAPFMVACKLMANQRNEEAMDWFHRVFDPTNTEGLSAPQRFWITRPFFEQNADDYREQRITSLLADLTGRADEVRAWKNNPFQPHAIARFRLVAYQKNVVMRYLDNLIAWGDQLFRRDTIESINRATLLYILAAELLGRRPEHVPAVPKPGRSYSELTSVGDLDIFGNAQVEVQLENFTDRRPLVITAPDGSALPLLQLSYFGLPANAKLLEYWTTVADRLFKIRNCMNLSGTVRQLPLFEPPIDPALLVQATASEVDLDSVLMDEPGSGSPYRFRTLMAKANELTADVRVLGDRLLAALDRRDAEALSRLRSGEEVAIQKLVIDVRAAQLSEAERARDAVEANRAVMQTRIDHYAGQPLTNSIEVIADQKRALAQTRLAAAARMENLAGYTALVPTFSVGIAGAGGSPTASASFGGGNIASSQSSFASEAHTNAASISNEGAMLETTSGRLRQYNQNQFQASVARVEMAQLDKQLLALAARIEVAQHELTVQEKLVQESEAIDAYMRSRYTNTELFDWLVGQLSTVYFQAYQLAYDLARKAERAYRFELSDRVSPRFIEFGYWDSLKKGLLAGDRLAVDLRRLETSSLDRHARRLQATTHVSLATLMPEKLLELKARGSTIIELPEWVFAAEHPGWLNARMLGVAVTVPGTTGPFVGVHAQLTLTHAVVRVNDSTAGGFGDALNSNDPRFASAMSVVSSIVTSHGSQDRGSVPSNEWADDRYTAFEGAGVISRWTITLDPRDNAFDLMSVTDLVLSIDYEGDPGSPALVDLARQAVIDAQPTAGSRLFALSSSYPGPWHQFFHPAAGADQVLRLTIQPSDLPFRYRQLAMTRQLGPIRADLVLMSDHSGQFDIRLAPPDHALPAAVPAPVDPTLGGLHHAVVSWLPNVHALFGDWQISIKRDDETKWTALTAADIEHAWLLIDFTA